MDATWLRGRQTGLFSKERGQRSRKRRASSHPSGMNLLGPTTTWSSPHSWKDLYSLLSLRVGISSSQEVAKHHHLLSVTAGPW